MNKKIALACVECKQKNYRVNKTKDKRLIIHKFCKKCNKHVIHKEEK